MKKIHVSAYVAASANGGAYVDRGVMFNLWTFVGNRGRRFKRAEAAATYPAELINRF